MLIGDLTLLSELVAYHETEAAEAKRALAPPDVGFTPREQAFFQGKIEEHTRYAEGLRKLILAQRS